MGEPSIDNGGQKGKKLLERAWDALLDAGVDGENARRLVAWMKEYILFHDRRHPQEMGMAEIQQYLGGHPFQNGRGPEDKAEAERALKFLYERVLERLWPMRQDEMSGEAGRTLTGKADGGKGVYLNGGDRSVKLMTRVQNALRVGQYGLETEKTYADWILKYIRFHELRHPEEMGAKEVEQFLTYLAVERQVSAKTQKQALCALVFLYQTVLGRKLGRVMPVRGRHGRRLPVVMTRREVPLVLREIVGMDGMFRLMSEVMYGSGPRRKEACRMRVKDVDLERRQLQICDGKGDQGRVTVLPERLVEPLRRQMERVRRLHEQDLAAGHGRVWLPPALRRKYPNAELELGWQYLFPSRTLSIDPREKQARVKRRHHVNVSSFDKAIKAAVRKSGLTKRITPHTFRHSFATHLLEMGHNVKQVQDLLGHKDIRTTMIYLHVMEGGTTGVRSPLDALG
jgi:integron integrase